MRAVAIVLVVLFHAGVPGFAGGFVGVDVFFVISGFVILRSLTGEQHKSGHVDWWAFYARRVRRLAPAAILMIVVTTLLSTVVLNPAGERQVVAKGAIAAATSTSNFYLAMLLGDYFVPTYQPNVFLHTWSLSVEEQFYLGVPLLFVITALVVHRRRRDRRSVMIGLIVLVCVVSLGVAVALAELAPTQAFYLPFGRAYELGIGALLAVVNRYSSNAGLRRSIWLVSAAVLGAVTVAGLPVFGFPGAWALLPTVATAAMIWAHITPADPGGRYLVSAPMVGIGKVSYGWYLWHWPLLSLVATWYLQQPPVWVRLIVVFVALGLAVLSYRYWEPRFRSAASGSARSPIGRRTVAAGAIAIAATCALAFGSLEVAGRLSQTPTWAAAWQAKSDNAFPARCLAVDDLDPRPQDSVCPINGFDPTRPTIAVWGDSFARMLLPGVVAAVGSRPVNIVALTRSACPPFLTAAAAQTAMPYGIVRSRIDGCRAHNDAALHWVLANHLAHPIRVIAGARWPVYQGHAELYPSLAQESREVIAGSGPAMDTGTPALLEHLDHSGVAVDLLGLSPELSRPAPECVTRRWRTYDCDVTMAAERRYWGDTEQWFAAVHDDLGGRSHVIDPRKLLCDNQMCFAQRDGIITFSDTDHLSAPAVRQLADQITPTVSDVLGAGATLDPH